MPDQGDSYVISKMASTPTGQKSSSQADEELEGQEEEGSKKSGDQIIAVIGKQQTENVECRHSH